MRSRPLIIPIAACLALVGCGGSRFARDPIGISGGINGLQQSACNCGGLETKKSFKMRRKAEVEAQQARSYEGDRN